MQKQLLIVFLFLPAVLFAQIQMAKVQVGPNFKQVEADHYRLFYVQDKVVMVSVHKLKVSIQTFERESLAPIHDEKFTFFNEQKYFEDLIEFQDKIYLFYRKKLKKPSRMVLMAVEIDPTVGKIFNKETQIVTATGELEHQAIESRRYLLFNTKRKFRIEVSEDESHILVYYANTNNKLVRRNPQYSFTVLGEDLAVKMNRRYTMPILQGAHIQPIIGVTNAGAVYCVLPSFIEVKKDEKGKITDRENFKSVGIFIFNNEEDEPVYWSKPSKDAIFKKYICSEKNNNIHFIGFLHPSKKGASFMDELFHCAIHTSGEILFETTAGFSPEVILEYESTIKRAKMEKRIAKNKPFMPYSFGFRNFIVNEDGSAILHGEVRSTGVVQTPNSKFIFEDIYMIKYNPDGKMEWTKKIPKHQVAQTPMLSVKQFLRGGFSFRMVHDKANNEDLYLFLDTEDNIGLKASGEVKPHRKENRGILNCYSINRATGAKSSLPLLNTEVLRKMNIRQFDILGATVTNGRDLIILTEKIGTKAVFVRLRIPQSSKS